MTQNKHQLIHWGRRSISAFAWWLVATSAAGAQARTLDGQLSDSASVHLLWSAIDAAWNQRDADRFSILFTEDASFEFVDRGESLETRATIHEHFADRFPGFSADLRHLTTLRDVRDIAPDVQTADGRVEILRVGAARSNESSVLRTFAIFAVMVRTAAGWKIQMLRVYQLPDGS